MTRAEVLDRTKQIVCNERNNEYGSPEDVFQVIADMWSSYLDVNIEPWQVAAMMVLFKVARMKHSDKMDNWLDACGYSSIGAELLSDRYAEFDELTKEEIEGFGIKINE